MSEHSFQDELEDRDDVVDAAEQDGGDEPDDGEPWGQTSSGEADDITTD